MAEFKPIRTTSNKVNFTDIPYVDGQIIYALDTNETFIDRGGDRIQQTYTLYGTSTKTPEWLGIIGFFMSNNGYSFAFDETENKFVVSKNGAPYVGSDLYTMLYVVMESVGIRPQSSAGTWSAEYTPGSPQNVLNLCNLILPNFQGGNNVSILEDLGYTHTIDTTQSGKVSIIALGDVMSHNYAKALQEQYNINWKASTVENPVTYKVGSLVIHEENNDIGIYRCNTQNSDTVWTVAHWDLITVLQSDITAIENTLDAMNDNIENALAGHFTTSNP